MSIDLLAVRYRVIADWPNNGWKIGTIITDGNSRYYDKYPHLYKKLEWWEQREVADMPEFAKDFENDLVGKVFRVLERGLCIGFRDNLVHYEKCLPATLKEFQEYQLKQQAQ